MQAETPKPNTYHHGDLRSCLTDLARSHVRAHGPESFSLRDISREAGVSHAAAYRHFPTKDALLDHVATQGFDELRQACSAAFTLERDSALDALAACGHAYVRFGRQQPNLLHLMFGKAGAWLETTAGDHPRARAAAALFQLLQGIIEAGQARGQIRREDPRAIAWACWAMVHGCASLAPHTDLPLPPAQERDIAQRIDGAIRAVVRGVAAQP